MKFILFIALFSGNVIAGPECSSFYFGREEKLVPEEVIQQLVNLNLEIILIADAHEKALALSDLKSKISEINKFYATDVKAEVRRRVNEQQQGVVEKKREAEKKIETARQSEEEIVSKFTRVRLHTKVKSVGPFLDETSFFTHRDGKLVLYDYKKEAIVDEWDMSGGNPKFNLTYDTDLRMTSDKKFLVLAQKNGIDVLNLNSGDVKRLELKTNLDRGYRGVKISKDDKYLFLAGEDGETHIFNLPDLKPILLKTTHDYAHGNMIVESPNGRYVFFVKTNDREVLYDLQENREIELPNFKEAGFHHAYDAFFSLDSNVLTIANHNDLPMDYHLQSGRFVPSRFKMRAKYLNVHNDGKTIVASKDGGGMGLKKGELPFAIFDRETAQDITPKFPDIDLQERSIFKNNGVADHILIFKDTVRELGKSPKQHYVYTLNLLTMELNQYPFGSEHYMMISHGFSPDGKSVLGKKNGGPVMEIY